MSADGSMKPEDILTPEQLAEQLQVGVTWVDEKSRSRGSHNRNLLPVLRCGRYLSFYWPDVCEWLRNGVEQHATTICSKQRK